MSERRRTGVMGERWTSWEEYMKTILRALPIALLLTTVSLDATAADWKRLTGTYAITAKNYLDPSDDEPKDSHLRIQLAGDAARDLYLAMKVAEKPDECTGATAKRVGEMQCLFYKGEKKYECHFAVDVMQQKIEHGVAC
jgi:hypothetical protein